MNKRIAARAVIIDDNLDIPILSVHNGAYYKIPGGKIEEGEDLTSGLRREIKEEVGCNIEIIGIVGECEFIMPEKNNVNYSICYLAKLAGDRGVPHFEAEEIERGFKLIWMNIDRAIETFEKCLPNVIIPHRRLIHSRDLNFLKQTKQLLEKLKV